MQETCGGDLPCDLGAGWLHTEGLRAKKKQCEQGMSLVAPALNPRVLWALFLKLHGAGMVRPRALLDSQSSSPPFSHLLGQECLQGEGLVPERRDRKDSRMHMPPVGSNVP